MKCPPNQSIPNLRKKNPDTSGNHNDTGLNLTGHFAMFIKIQHGANQLQSWT